MNAVTVSLKFIPTIALLNRLCVLTSPKYIICIIKYLWVLFLTMMGKICVFICKEWQQRVWVTYFVFVVLWRDFEFCFWFFSTRSKMMGRTFKCMFFIQRDWLFLSRVKRECKDQSPSLLFRKNLAFRRFFYCNSYSSLASLTSNVVSCVVLLGLWPPSNFHTHTQYFPPLFSNINLNN